MPETLETDSSLRTLRGTVGDICQESRRFDLYTEGLFKDPMTVYLTEPDPRLTFGSEVEISVPEGCMEGSEVTVSPKYIRYV